MEIRDVIHGSISIEAGEHAVIDSRYFQRMRNIKQLGFAEFSYPSATHNRYIHSLGAMEVATRAFDTIFKGRKNHGRFRALVRLAALLHDIGHGPLSHTTEFAMPAVKLLKLPLPGFQKARQATHEDYTLKIILDSGLTPILERAGRSHGFTPLHIAALIDGSIAVDDDFFRESAEGEAGESVDFRPILQQLISSELDADRMDYLRRDSFHAGVSYGQFDVDWLISNLISHVKNKRCYLAFQHRALYAFEDFLISRFHMFMMVYFHYKSVVFDSMLGQYFASPDCTYALPADVEAYTDCNDAQLYAHLAKSKNEWAVRITDKKPFRMLVELHSGIPATARAATERTRLLARIEKDLKARKIQYLHCTSTGELSKYFRKPGDPIFVRYDNHFSTPSLIPVEQCTDLFQRYREKRSISRLYISPEHFAEFRRRGREEALPYEDLLEAEAPSDIDAACPPKSPLPA